MSEPDCSQQAYAEERHDHDLRKLEAEPLEAAIALLESTANLLRGMCMDPTIPVHAREALRQRVEQIDATVVVAIEASP